jgi:hypothetical protein
MQIEKVSYAGNPERVTDESFDCVWVRFGERQSPSPILSQVLQWVDWRLQGQLSRFLLEADSGKRQTTFLPTGNRIQTPLVALDPPGDVDWELFGTNCTGMGFKKLLILCEETADLSALEKDLRKHIPDGVEKVTLGSDGPVGRG